MTHRLGLAGTHKLVSRFDSSHHWERWGGAVDEAPSRVDERITDGLVANNHR